jgi:6-phospho-beta-glucosidase
MKLVIAGGGSSYTPELIDGMIQHWSTFPVSKICLFDINPARLDVLCGLSQRMVDRAGLAVRVTAETERRKAFEGAAFVNGLIRVGGMEARILDERIPLQHGVVGQETTGPGGMMKALRTIPAMLAIANDMVEVCPDAWLINYSNPSGIIAEALGKHSQVKYISLCSGPAGWISQILRLMDVSPERANVDWVGLNHLGFAIRVWVDGVDVTADAVDAAAHAWNIDGDWMRMLGAIPATYLRYFYHHDEVLAEYQQPGHRTRGEVVREIETELLRQYADPTLAEKPELLKRRGGGGYSDVAIAAMESIYHNRGDRQIVQVQNTGAVDDLPEDASVELACVIDRMGAHPIRLGTLPLAIRGLVQSVKAYESLTVQAAVEGSRRTALQALMAHPLVPSWNVAKELLAELLAANKSWLDWA